MTQYFCVFTLFFYNNTLKLGSNSVLWRTRWKNKRAQKEKNELMKKEEGKDQERIGDGR